MTEDFGTQLFEAQIKQRLREIARDGLIVPIVVDGEEFYQVTAAGLASLRERK